jgi:transposase
MGTSDTPRKEDIAGIVERVTFHNEENGFCVATGMVLGMKRQPLKKVDPDENQLPKLMNRWRHEALQAGHAIERVVAAYEAGGDGFWLARWLRARGVEAYVMHPASVAVSREHRRAKTDRLDTQLLMRAFLGWLRGERRHCSMAAIPRLKRRTQNGPIASMKSSSAIARASSIE